MTAAKAIIKAKRSPHARLTPKQWAEAEALWESGEVTLDDLAAKFKKDKSAFSRHFDKNSIKKGAKRDEHKKKVAAEVTKAAIDEATVTAARIKETKEEHYKMAAALAKLTWSEILAAKQNNTPVAVAMNNLKALESAMNVLKKAREERYAVLGLDRDDHVDENELPELVIAELTAEQVEELRSRDNAGLENLGVVVQGEEDEADEEEDDDGIIEES